jgi:hypothetical protein
MLTSNPETVSSKFVITELLPALEKIKNKNYYFISGDLRSNLKPAFFYYHQNNFTYTASSFNGTANDVFLEIIINRQTSEVEFRARRANLSLIQNIDQFGVDAWLEEIKANPKFYTALN